MTDTPNPTPEQQPNPGAGESTEQPPAQSTPQSLTMNTSTPAQQPQPAPASQPQQQPSSPPAQATPQPAQQPVQPAAQPTQPVQTTPQPSQQPAQPAAQPAPATPQPAQQPVQPAASPPASTGYTVNAPTPAVESPLPRPAAAPAEPAKVESPIAEPAATEETPIPEHYFLINPQNEDVATGDSRSLPPIGIRLVLLFGIPFALIGLGLLWFAFTKVQPLLAQIQTATITAGTLGSALLWVIIALLFNLFVIGLYISAWGLNASRRRLEKRGQVVWGEVISASGAQNPDGKVTVTLKYRFKRPDRRRRRMIEDKIKERRDDLRDKSLPSPGTPVAVLYLSRKNYELL